MSTSMPAADPTVRLRMDRRTYARLAGGRWDATTAAKRGTLAIEGDQELGRRVVEHLGFTI